MSSPGLSFRYCIVLLLLYYIILSYTEYRVPGRKETENEEVIRCICGVLREEGDMLMCDKCEVCTEPITTCVLACW